MADPNAGVLHAGGPMVPGVWLSNDEHVRVVAFCSAANVRLALDARLLADDGTFATLGVELAPTSDRLASRAIAGARQGWLQHGQVRLVSGTPKVGQVFVRVEVVRGRTGDVIPLATLAQGYVSELANVAWPANAGRDALAGRGFVRTYTGSDPAAGAEFSETVPTGARWILYAVRASLVTDATVANRIPTLLLDDGSTVYNHAGFSTNHAASLTFAYAWGQYGAANFNNAAACTVCAPFPIAVPAGGRIRSSTANFQAGDNWGAPVFAVEEFIEG